MAWTGYNTEESLKVILQPTGEWNSNSKPFTIKGVELINDQIYNEINMILERDGINISTLTATELSVLSLINSYGSASILEKVRYSKVPQRTQEKAQPATDWQLRYKESLNNFLDAKKKKNSQIESFGTYSGTNDIELTPLFTIGDSW